MAFRPSKSIPMGSASGLEKVDHVCPTTKRFVWRNAWRSLIARPAPAKSLSMNMRIGPRELGIRSSVLRRLAVGEYTVRASSPALGTPTGIEEVTNLSSVPRALRVWTATIRAWPPSLKADSVPGMRIEPGNSPAVTTAAGRSGVGSAAVRLVGCCGTGA